MSDLAVKVTIDETPVEVIISDNTPVINILDENTSTVVTLNANPETVVLAEDSVAVTVLLNGGRPNPRIVTDDLPDLLYVLSSSLTVDQFEPSLAASIAMIDTLDNNLTVVADDTNTNTSSISVLVGRVDTDSAFLYSSISLHDDAIDLLSTRVTTNESGLVSHSGEFHVTPEAITAMVDATTVNEGEINSVRSGMELNADNITLFSSTTDGLGTEIDVLRTDLTTQELALQAVDDEAVIQYSLIQLNSDNITSQVVTIDGINNELLSVNETLTDHSATLSVQSDQIGGANASISAVRTMLDNSWAVSIVEDSVDGNYATGFGIQMYQDWTSGKVYAIDDRVFLTDTVYKCILDHTADLTNNPPNITYWEIDPEGVKSTFSVQVDKFEVRDPAGGAGIAPFSIESGVVTINGTLRIVGTSIDPTDATWTNLWSTNQISNVEANATAGATWGVNVDGLNLPASNATVGATWGVDIGGSNLPADNATVGATATEAANISMSAGWAYTGTTEIDGGNIYADTITAVHILAATITTDLLAANAATQIVNSTTYTASPSFTDTSTYVQIMQLPVLSLAYGKVTLSGSIRIRNNTASSINLGQVHIYRDNTSTLLTVARGNLVIISGDEIVVPLNFVEAAIGGSHTYYVYASADGALTVGNGVFTGINNKR